MSSNGSRWDSSHDAFTEDAMAGKFVSARRAIISVGVGLRKLSTSVRGARELASKLDWQSNIEPGGPGKFTGCGCLECCSDEMKVCRSNPCRANSSFRLASVREAVANHIVLASLACSAPLAAKGVSRIGSVRAEGGETGGGSGGGFGKGVTSASAPLSQSF